LKKTENSLVALLATVTTPAGDGPSGINFTHTDDVFIFLMERLSFSYPLRLVSLGK